MTNISLWFWHSEPIREAKYIVVNNGGPISSKTNGLVNVKAATFLSYAECINFYSNDLSNNERKNWKIYALHAEEVDE